MKKAKPKTNKYHNKKCEYKGIKFDSERERDAYIYLEPLIERGVITNMVVHPQWELIPALKETFIKHLKTKDKVCERTIQRPITYSADFKFDYKGQTLCFDIKITPYLLPKEYTLKVKMMRYFHGIKVIEIYKVSDFDKYIN
jgi:hypothetical protein